MSIDPVRPTTLPQRRLGEREGIGINILNRLIATGELDTIIIGERHRHVVMASWEAYVDRRRRGIERDPIEKAAAIAGYRSSLLLPGMGAAKRARSGKHDRKAVARQAKPAQTLLPRQTCALQTAGQGQASGVVVASSRKQENS